MNEENKDPFIELVLKDKKDIELIQLLTKDFDPHTVIKKLILGD